MCRLRTNFARLGYPLQGLHNRNAPLLVPAAPLLLKGSMSLDFRVAALPYKSSSFATPEGEVLVAICNEQLKLVQGESIEQIST